MSPCFVIEIPENGRRILALTLFALNSIIICISTASLIPYWHLKTRLTFLLHLPRIGPDSLQILLLSSISIFLVLHTFGAYLCWHASAVANRYSAAAFLSNWSTITRSLLWLSPMCAVLAFTQQTPLINSLNRELLIAMREYKHHAAVRVGINHLQRELRCCGHRNLTDWLLVSWQDLPPLDEDIGTWRVNDAVPFSCCNPSFGGPCLRHRSVLSSFYDSMFQVGCGSAMSSSLGNALDLIWLLEVVIFILQIFILVLLQYFISAISTSFLNENPLMPSLGWLFDHFGSLSNEKDVSAEELRDKLTAALIAAAWGRRSH